MADHCQPIRDDIAEVKKDISDKEDALDEVPASLKAIFLEQIKREKVTLKRLQRALKACESGR